MDSSISFENTHREHTSGYFKEIEEIRFDCLFDFCPVEIIKAVTMYDIESFRYYIDLVFRNMSEVPIDEVNVMLMLYDGNNIPFAKLPVTYGIAPELGMKASYGRISYAPVQPSDEFGRGIRIPLPDSYFKRLEAVVCDVAFSNGKRFVYNAQAKYIPRSLSEFTAAEKNAYDTVNIYEKLEDRFPTRFSPVVNDYSWICCCGHKNPLSAEKCEDCTRERDWELTVMDSENLEKAHEEYMREHSPQFVSGYKKEFMKKREIVNAREQSEKEQLALKALKNVEKQEKRKESLIKQIIPRIALYFAVMALLLAFLYWLSLFTNDIW